MFILVFSVLIRTFLPSGGEVVEATFLFLSFQLKRLTCSMLSHHVKWFLSVVRTKRLQLSAVELHFASRAAVLI